MGRVYRPASRFLRIVVAVAAIAGGGCGEPASAPAARQAGGPGPGGRSGEPSPPRVEPYGLATLLASRSHTAIALTPDGRALLASAGDGRLLLWSLPATRPSELSGDARLVPLALYPDGRRALTSEAPESAGAPARLLRIDALGERSALPVVLLHPRFLGWKDDGSAFFLSGGRDNGAAVLYEIAAETLVAQLAAELPPGFEIAAVSADGATLAARRELHPEADEIYLRDRTTGETRLFLPSGADARFSPVGFSRGHESLLVLTDEGAQAPGLVWLDLASGARRPLPPSSTRAGCEIVDAALAAETTTIVATTVCSGVRQATLLAADTGDTIGMPLLPADVRAVQALVNGADGAATISVASARLPRDLLWRAAGAPDLIPLTWGLPPGVDPALLSSARIDLVPGGGVPLPVELWPAMSVARSAGSPRAGLVWIEDDANPPAWNEFDPFFQFLAGRDAAVARIRLRGSDGFGRNFRHAADGRLLESAIEDLEAARRVLLERGVDPGRIALVGQGGWPAAVAASMATGGVQTAPEFAAFAALGADPDPLARLDAIAALPEPAKSWWTARLGDPADPRTAADRLATGAARRAGVAAVAPLFEGAREPDYETLWRFLAPRLEAP